VDSGALQPSEPAPNLRQGTAALRPEASLALNCAVEQQAVADSGSDAHKDEGVSAGTRAQQADSAVEIAAKTSATTPKSGSSEADAPGVVDSSALTPERWPEGFERFHFTGILHNIALNLALIDSAGSALEFCIKEKDATLLNERHPAQLSQALSQQLGQSVVATITVSDHDGRTPAQYRAALAEARLAEAQQAISSDQALNRLITAFDGHIIPGSIRPNQADGDSAPLQHDAD